MVAVVAMIIGYLCFCDLKVVLYIGIGVLLAKILFSMAFKYFNAINREEYDAINREEYDAINREE